MILFQRGRVLLSSGGSARGFMKATTASLSRKAFGHDILRNQFCISPYYLQRPQIQNHRSHSSWKPPQNQPIPNSLAQFKQHTYNMKDLSPVAAYRLLIGCIAPRPIALTTTIELSEVKGNPLSDSNENRDDVKGILNCAPFSFFNIVSFNPPLLSLAIQRDQGKKKDTLRNIETNNEFTVSIISEHFLQSANHTCGNFPSNVNEIEKSGLSTLPSTQITPPRIAESLVQMECRLYDVPQTIMNDSGEATAELVLGRILCIHVNEGIIQKAEKEGRADEVILEKLKPVGRAGGNEYTFIQFPTTDIPRPDV